MYRQSEKLFCYLCKNELPFFPNGGGTSGNRGMYYCDNSSCELEGIQQPQNNGGSNVSFGNDNSYTVLRRGPFTQNEGNLSSVASRLMDKLADNIKVSVVEGRESGADLKSNCSICKTELEYQVTRVLDSKFARSASKEEMIWATYTILEICQRLSDCIEKKSNSYSAADISTRVLVLDPTVDVFWPIMLGTKLTSLREFFVDVKWFSVVMLGDAQPVRLCGKEMTEWCGCSESRKSKA